MYKYGNCRHHTKRQCAIFVSAFHRRVSLCYFCNFFPSSCVDELLDLWRDGTEIKGIDGPVRVLLLAFNVDYPGYCTSFFVAYLCVASGKLMEMRYAGSFGCRRCYMSPIKKNVWGNYHMFLDHKQSLTYVSNRNVQAILIL